jgi:hypothetical protein
MILIHGDCDSGKSRALHALEFAPPADYRAVYVPVPSLDFAGLARWCLDRLNATPGDDPIAALRAVVGQRRVLVLVDDAHRLPLETALALRQFERAAKGQLAVVAACGSDERGSSSVVALGEPAASFALEPERGRGAEEAAASVCAAFSPSVEQRAPAVRPQQLAVRAPEAPRARAEPVRPRELPAAAPAQAIAPSPALEAVARPPRSVPLGLTIALACTAFLIPVAFGAGFILGREPARAELTASANPGLPPVAAAPPGPREREAEAEAEAAFPLEAVRLPELAAVEPEKSRTAAPVPAAAEPAPDRVVASALSAAARPRESAAVVEAWGAPTLISVAPAPDAP